MSMKLSSRRVDGLQSRDERQREAADAPRARTSAGMRKVKRLGWNLLPPLTFVAIIAI